MRKSFLLFICFLFLSVGAFAADKIKIGATPVPHGEILNFIKPDLEADGLEMDVVIFTDYVTPNIALTDKSIDANLFQHTPFLEAFNKAKGANLIGVIDVFIAPVGFYSDKFKDISEIKKGATIAIPNDRSNGGRALLLLESVGLLELKNKPGVDPTVRDIAKNPLKIKIKEVDAAQLPRVLRDVDAAIINSNFAINAKLNPTEDALFFEDANSPYVNVVAVRADDPKTEQIELIKKHLQSDKTKAFILEKYSGSIIPVF